MLTFETEATPALSVTALPTELPFSVKFIVFPLMAPPPLVCVIVAESETEVLP
jgi:hypothetical protein